MRRKFGIASHQITQLKDEIQTKDQALSNEIYEKAEKEKEIQKLQAENKLKDKAFKKSEDHQRQLKGTAKEGGFMAEKYAEDFDNFLPKLG